MQLVVVFSRGEELSGAEKKSDRGTSLVNATANCILLTGLEIASFWGMA
jgi:hypothetical protein